MGDIYQVINIMINIMIYIMIFLTKKSINISCIMKSGKFDMPLA